jgi:hypothetical protein
MAGLLEELADRDSQRLGDGGHRRGTGVDATTLGARDSWTEQAAAVGHLGETQTFALPGSFDALHLFGV